MDYWSRLKDHFHDELAISRVVMGSTCLLKGSNSVDTDHHGDCGKEGGQHGFGFQSN